MITALGNDSTLTEFDAENWWDFLMHEYPRNYACACQYYSNQDPDLELEGCCPRNFYINDYFTICELPRITAQDGIIKVNDKPVKRYDGYRGWKRKRIEFEKLKREKTFWAWKKEQYQCQNAKCAWCKKHIYLKSPFTEVDHVKPLIYDGTNDFKNLVLACSDCNQHKGGKISGYNDGMRDRVNNSVPSWIKYNHFSNHDLPHIEVTEREIDEFDNHNKKYRKTKKIEELIPNFEYNLSEVPF